MQLGNRVIFDQDGEIFFQTGEMQGDVLPRKQNIQLDYIDLEYGEVNYVKFKIIGVNPQTRQPILVEIPQQPAPYQRIEELENQILIAEGVI